MGTRQGLLSVCWFDDLDDLDGLDEHGKIPDLMGQLVAEDQALTSTRGYSLPDFLDYYPYPTRNFLLPDRVEGSEEHPLCPITDKSME